MVADNHDAFLAVLLGAPTPEELYQDRVVSFIEGVCSSALTSLVLYLYSPNVPWDALKNLHTLELLRLVTPSPGQVRPDDLEPLSRKHLQVDDELGWWLPKLRTLILEKKVPCGSDLHGAVLPENRRLTTEKLFEKRWAAAEGETARVTSLKIAWRRSCAIH
ncbi:hypothetical protein CALCODRAFT_502797, partial [Calocera cornea HHB12733]